MKKLNLKTETIDGYEVSSAMKKVWKVEHDILAEFDRICKKYDLKYIMFDGSLLGLIRHHGGFIPWDDDIDVAMTREEFEKFRKIAQKELKEPYFFQTTLNDKVFRSIGQIRNSETTAIMYKEFLKEANQGIFIDIFIIDKLPKNKLKRLVQKRRCRMMKSLLRFYRVYECKEKHGVKSKIIKFLLDIFYGIFGYENFFKHYEKVCAKYNKTDSTECNIIEYGYDDRIIRLKHLEKTKMCDFYDLRVPIPEEAEEFLTDYFGDWKTPVIGKDDHGNMFFDTEKSYREYLRCSMDELMKIGEKKWLKKN